MTNDSVEVTQADEALAKLCVPTALIFADAEEHIEDARHRAAQHIARHRLSATSSGEVERLRWLLNRVTHLAETLSSDVPITPQAHQCLIDARAALSTQPEANPSVSAPDVSMANRPGHCSECGGKGAHADDCSHSTREC